MQNIKFQEYPFYNDRKGIQLVDRDFSILDAFPFYVMLIDSKHRILFANKAIKNHLNIDSDLLGRYCPQVIHGVDYFPGCPFEKAINNQESTISEFFDPALKRWIRASLHPAGFSTAEGLPVFLHTARDVTEERRTRDELQRRHDIQNVINTLLQLGLQDLDTQEILQRALDLLLSLDWLAIDSRGSIFLVEDRPDVLVMKAQRNLGVPVQKACSQVKFGSCLCGLAASSQKIQFSSHVDERHTVQYDAMVPHGHYCIPIIFDGKTLGVINTYLSEGHAIQELETDFLTAIANALAGVLVRKKTILALKQSVEVLKDTFEGTARALASLAEKRDSYTAGHQQRVTDLAVAIGKEMDLTGEQIEGIRVAGILHDLGKIYVPAEILSKPGRLSDLEFRMIRVHPEVGYDIIKEVKFPWPVAKAVCQHHERMNGSGYPAGLVGDEIILEARIIAVADVVEAMSSHRPYRPAIGLTPALNEIAQNKEILYDSAVVDACLRLFKDKNYQFAQ